MVTLDRSISSPQVATHDQPVLQVMPTYSDESMYRAVDDLLNVAHCSIDYLMVDALFHDIPKMPTVTIYHDSCLRPLVLTFLGEHLKHLEALHIQTRNYIGNENEITDSELETFATNAKALKKFTIQNCPHITGPGLLRFLEKCPGLEEFSADLNCFGIEHVEALANHQVKVIRMRKLTLKESESTSSATLLKFLEKCTELREFTSDIAVLNDAHVGALLRNRKLRQVRIHGAHRISASGFCRIIQDAQKLTLLQGSINHMLDEDDVDDISFALQNKNIDVDIQYTVLTEEIQPPQALGG